MNKEANGFAPPPRTYQPPTAEAYTPPDQYDQYDIYSSYTPDSSRPSSMALSKRASSTAHPGTLVGGEEQDVITQLPMGRLADRSPRPISKEDYRPMTGSTKRLSLTSWVSKRSIKYGTGRFARVELIPQPSDDPEDPLVS